MKKILPLLLVLVFAASCGTSKFSKSGTAEKEFISKFLTYMDHSNGPKYTLLMDCISPAYLKANNIDRGVFKVDNYSIWGHSIEGFNNGLVEAKIWGEDRKWVHLLTFKLVKSGGKLYIVPSSHSDSYIHPWWERKTYIKE